jgi:hypothetical protein
MKSASELVLKKINFLIELKATSKSIFTTTNPSTKTTK